mgnify:CR=1 FL=1
MNNLPKDPVMLLSFVNMQLRIITAHSQNYVRLIWLTRAVSQTNSPLSIMYTILRLTNLYNY